MAHHNTHWLREKRAELLKKKNPKSQKYSLLLGWIDSWVRWHAPAISDGVTAPVLTTAVFYQRLSLKHPNYEIHFSFSSNLIYEFKRGVFIFLHACSMFNFFSFIHWSSSKVSRICWCFITFKLVLGVVLFDVDSP